MTKAPNGKVAKCRFKEFSLNQRRMPAQLLLTQSRNHQLSDSVLAVASQAVDRQAVVFNVLSLYISP